MNIKKNAKTGETSIKLIEAEKRYVETALSICETIARNAVMGDKSRYEFEAAIEAIRVGTRKYVDQPAEPVMDPEQTGVMEEPARVTHEVPLKRTYNRQTKSYE